VLGTLTILLPHSDQLPVLMAEETQRIGTAAFGDVRHNNYSRSSGIDSVQAFTSAQVTEIVRAIKKVNARAEAA